MCVMHINCSCVDDDGYDVCGIFMFFFLPILLFYLLINISHMVKPILIDSFISHDEKHEWDMIHDGDVDTFNAWLLQI